MFFSDFRIVAIIPILPEVFILRIKPEKGGGITPFSPGQYVSIQNPQYDRPAEIHKFSIASSPATTEFLEFCIKIYGNWTKTLARLSPGEILKVGEPLGKFIWTPGDDQNAVFLAGGLGIAPIMSMLRFIQEGKYRGNYVLVYGSRTPETMAYKNELNVFAQSISHFRLINVFSHLPAAYSWQSLYAGVQGYRGFFTKEILEEEVDFSLHPTFFIIGPPVFIKKMRVIVQKLKIPKKKIKIESLA